MPDTGGINGVQDALVIRPAAPADVPLMLSLVRELAEFEREPNAVKATEEDFMRDAFGPQPRFHCVIAEWWGEPAGFALYFYNYSTWVGKAGIYLEDLFVRSAYREKGIGKHLFRHMARLAVEQNLGRLVWNVLKWNETAIRFYESLGAVDLCEWTTMRLNRKDLERLAAEFA